MKSSLSGSTYILLTAKSSVDIYILGRNCQTLKEKTVMQVRPYDKISFLPEGFVYFSFS